MVQRDVLDECRVEIAEAILQRAWFDVRGATVDGLAQWYKSELSA